MKNFSKIFAFVAVLALATTLASFTFDEQSDDICIYVKNNTGHSVTIHTGRGTSPMSNGATKKFCYSEGRALYFADRGRKGKKIIEFTSAMDGKKISLADYE